MPWTVIRLLAVFAVLAAPAAAEQPSLSLPIDCVPGETCWVAQYMDLDAGPEARDFACGRMSYDGHNGTDFALRDLKALFDGVAVLAAAPGIVTGVRDGLPDVSVRELKNPAVVRGRECGNGVVVRHGGGWETQYCHLRYGSVSVRPGDRVRTGQPLGFVGMSGAAEFPHVQFEARFDGRPVDPFVGLKRTKPCGVGDTPLWNGAALSQLDYQGAAIFGAGFAPWPPELTAVADGNYSGALLAPDAPALVFWMLMYGARSGDALTMTITGHDGSEILRSEKRFEKSQVRRMEFAGLKRQAKRWPAGTYVGEAVLTRIDGGTERRFSIRRSVEIP